MLCKEVTRGSKKISPEITDVIKNVITPAAEENTIMRKTLQDTKKNMKRRKEHKKNKSGYKPDTNVYGGHSKSTYVTYTLLHNKNKSNKQGIKKA